MFTDFYTLVLYFTLYSFIGWVCESIWVSVGTKKVVNRGFLSGPYCPIYGFGALIILLFCEQLKPWPPLVFIVAMVSASVLEYFTGWLLETLFHTRWWDYSKRKFNLKGRVCLRNSLLFGLMGLIVTYFADPLARDLIALLSPVWQRGLAVAILVLLAADLTNTVVTILGLKNRVHDLRGYIKTLEAYNTEHSWLDVRDIQGSAARLRAIAANDTENEEAATILKRLDDLTARHKESMRLIHAFPNLTHKDAEAEWAALRQTWLDEIKARREKRRARKDGTEDLPEGEA